MSDEKYGSALYLIDEAAEKLSEARKKAENYNEERGKISKFPKEIRNGGWPHTSELSFSTNPESYHNGGSYNRFDETKRNHVEGTYVSAKTHIEKVSAKLELFHAENLPTIETNKKCRENIFKFMESYGIPLTKYINAKIGCKTESRQIACEWKREVEELALIDDNYEGYKLSLKSFLRQLEEWRKNKLAKITAKEQEEEKKLLESKELAEALLYYKEQGWSTGGLTSQHILDYVEDHKERKFVAENFPDGLALDISCCDFCSTWVVGEPRCSCGNRRMSLTVEKGVDGEYYAYGEAH
jgi:hypothetical protein